jgi:hypothetical protein
VALDVRQLLAALGIQGHRDTGAKITAPCPHPDHDDQDPSWSIIADASDPRNGWHYCHGCKRGGGAKRLAAWVLGVGVAEAARRLGIEEQGGRTAPPVPTTFSPHVVAGRGLIDRAVCEVPPMAVFPDLLSEWHATPRQYVLGRGVTPEQVERWGIGYALWGGRGMRIIIPVRDEHGDVLTYVARSFAAGEDVRYMNASGREAPRARHALLGAHLVRSWDEGTLAEGIWSLLAFERRGWPGPVGLAGSALTPERVPFLRRFKRLYVGTDPDRAGEAAFHAVNLLARSGTDVVRLELSGMPDELGDDLPAYSS